MKHPGIARLMRDERGSALVSAFVVIVVVLILGLGILTLSTANIAQAKVDDTYARDYHVAGGGARQGIEALKNAALDQYRKIADDLESNIQSTNNAASFFSALDAFAYSPRQPDASSGGPTSLAVAISHAAVDADTRRYTVLATATDGKTPRRVASSIDIRFIPVEKTSGFTPLGTQAVIAGGTLVQNQGYTSITDTTDLAFPVKFGSMPSCKSYALNGAYKADLSPYVDPATADSLSWDMDYPGFTSAVKPSGSQLSLPAYTSPATITNMSFGGSAPSPVYLDLEGSSGAYTMSSFNYVGGTVYCTASLTASNPYITGTASSYVNIYCRGNLTLNGVIARYVNIYCDGNVAINGGNSYRNVTVYCNGTINDSCTDRRDVRYYCGAYRMNGGNFHGDNIVYTENSLHLESTVSGLFYSNGAIDVGSGSGVTGQVVAKGNITMNGSFNFTYDDDMIQRLNVDPFTTSTGGGATAITQPPDALIFSGASPLTEH